MSIPCVNSSSYISHDINKTRSRIHLLSFLSVSVLAICTIASIVFANLGAALIGGLSVFLITIIGVLCSRNKPDKYQTETSGRVFDENPQTKSPLASDEDKEKKLDSRDVSIIIEHPRGELKEVTDALLQEVDPFLSAIIPPDEEITPRPVTPPPTRPVTPPPPQPKTEPSPVAKKTGWNPFSSGK